ncbi:MAG: gliding motility-associated C-terminal domain-containing protein [Bacteroidetes bacterium]|nr:gliding motility-associated C-terminal domain-containing protein [Bacteroidota bacterium]
MRKISLLWVAFLSVAFAFAQCELTVVDTTHVDCSGESTGGFVLGVSSAVSPYSIALSNGVTQLDDPVFSALLAGDYTISITDANGCSDVVSVKVKEPSLLLMNLSCEGVRLLSEVSGGVKDYAYTWSDENGQVFSTDTVVDFEPNSMYAFEVIDAKGCSRKDTVYVWADFEVNRVIGEIPFDVYFTNNSSVGLYEWDFGGLRASSSFEPSYTFDEVGEYEISLSVVDESSSCSADFLQKVDAQGFEMKGEADWAEMYDVFTPNSDGVNEEFAFLENHAIASFEAVVYNRWGKKIYHWTDPKAGWPGVNKSGNSVSEGVYFYSMNAVGVDGTEYQKKGTISLYK